MAFWTRYLRHYRMYRSSRFGRLSSLYYAWWLTKLGWDRERTEGRTKYDLDMTAGRRRTDG